MYPIHDSTSFYVAHVAAPASPVTPRYQTVTLHMYVRSHQVERIAIKSWCIFQAGCERKLVSVRPIAKLTHRTPWLSSHPADKTKQTRLSNFSPSLTATVDIMHMLN